MKTFVGSRSCWTACAGCTTFILFGLLTPSVPLIAEESVAPVTASPLHGALLTPTEASVARLNELKTSGTNTVVFVLDGSNKTAKQAVRVAVANAEQIGHAFGYWIEVARSPELAAEHPEWMASLQTHDQWRRFFPTGSSTQGE